jgi:hypothetical protein
MMVVVKGNYDSDAVPAFNILTAASILRGRGLLLLPPRQRRRRACNIAIYNNHDNIVLVILKTLLPII